MPGPLHCYIGIGSNLGDRLGNLQRAVETLQQSKGLEVTAASTVYESPAWGYDSPNNYYNAVLEAEWNGTPLKLAELCYKVEAAGGRHRQGGKFPPEYADRTIDLDLLWIDGVETNDDRLILPHPRSHQRAFVLIPWQELHPDVLLKDRSLLGWIKELPTDDIKAIAMVPGGSLVIPAKD